MDFVEMLAMLQGGADDLPDTIYDDLRNSYQLTVEGSQASLAERDAAIAARDEEIAKLKAMNFELLTAAPGNVDVDDEDSPDDTDPGDDNLSIEDLFTTERRN